MLDWLFKRDTMLRAQASPFSREYRTGDKTFGTYERLSPGGVDIPNPAVLDGYESKTTINEREGVKQTMPNAKPRNVRYTGHFQFEVASEDPRLAAEKLDAIRATGATIKNVRSVNVKADRVDERPIVSEGQV